MTEADFRIREARDQDRTTIELLDEHASREGSRYRGSEQLTSHLGSFDDRWSSRSSSRTMYVATVHDEIVGWASVVQLPSQRALLESIFVLPQGRNLGIGSGLLREAVQRFGLDKLDALSLPGDRLTKNLYERGGLKARLIVATAL